MRKRTLLLTIAVVIVAGIAAFGWMTIRRGFSARDKPSAMEAYMAKTARKLAIPASERDAKNPFMPTAEVLSEARSHFADHCATCHGNDGSGKTEIGQNLYPKAPDMRQPNTQDHPITVQTKAKEPVTVYTMPDTKYEKSGSVSTPVPSTSAFAPRPASASKFVADNSDTRRRLASATIALASGCSELIDKDLSALSVAIAFKPRSMRLF